ncbi:MATE family efflux transporter [Halorussus salilacus]|uniref:MATE family efflux transporter n=1 Tax=Halorussus salilacus TaxID=2953750 RepID=UPI0020A0E4DE|nr:MATE family efflux transporter [Halorussus salilacus]USZ66720.1 MATE family efflux transporter [Halorussus salilacus]
MIRELVRRRSRLVSVWRRVFELSWPVATEQVLRNLMRTTDVLVTGLFSPAAIAALGLADLYGRLPYRIGMGIGGGAIALSSQDTGSGATENRDEAVTQALLLGILFGVPFVIFGVTFGDVAISMLGAPENVVTMGGTYLAIIFATTPARHLTLIGTRSLQGIGDARTPMYINVASNLLNIAGTVALGLGLGFFPELEIVGVGIATAVGNVFSATVMVAILWSNRTPIGFTRPTDFTITRQLFSVSVPRIAEAGVVTITEFPFNAILLMFGTNVNAGYQVARRIYQQLNAPLSRGYSVASSVLVGQAVGEGNIDDAHFNGWATAGLGLSTVGLFGIGLHLYANQIVLLFTSDSTTIRYATEFTQIYGLIAPLLVLYLVFVGGLQGGSDTRTPLFIQTVGLVILRLGLAYVVAVALGYGLSGVYAAIVVYYVWLMVAAGTEFYRGTWADRATEMMIQRGSGDTR